MATTRRVVCVRGQVCADGGIVTGRHGVRRFRTTEGALHTRTHGDVIALLLERKFHCTSRPGPDPDGDRVTQTQSAGLNRGGSPGHTGLRELPAMTPLSSRPTLVLFHGAGANEHIYDPVLRLLPPGRAVALSYPGRCQQPGPLLRDIEALAAWADQAVEALGLQDVVLAGHSLGTAVAVGAANALVRRNACKVHRVIMLSTPTRPASVKAVSRLWRNAVQTGRTDSARAMGFLPNTPAVFLDWTQQVESQTPLEAIAADWEVALSIGDRTPPSLPLPIQFVSGDQDRMSPADGLHQWASALPQASVDLWPGVGHRLDVTEVERLAALLVSALG